MSSQLRRGSNMFSRCRKVELRRGCKTQQRNEASSVARLLFATHTTFSKSRTFWFSGAMQSHKSWGILACTNPELSLLKCPIIITTATAKAGATRKEHENSPSSYSREPLWAILGTLFWHTSTTGGRFTIKFYINILKKGFWSPNKMLIFLTAFLHVAWFL